MGEGSLNDKREYSFRAFRDEDETDIKRLVKNACASSEFWDWKYKLNPNFHPSLIMVAEKDAKVIGCNHLLLKNFKLGPSIETKAVLGADLVVDPEIRRKGIGTKLIRFQRASEIMKNESVAMAYMFADPVLAKDFH